MFTRFLKAGLHPLTPAKVRSWASLHMIRAGDCILLAALSCTGIARAVVCLGNALVGMESRAEVKLLLLPGIGLGAATRKFVEVMGITWAGSQITKVTIRSRNWAT